MSEPLPSVPTGLLSFFIIKPSTGRPRTRRTRRIRRTFRVRQHCLSRHLPRRHPRHQPPGRRSVRGERRGVVLAGSSSRPLGGDQIEVQVADRAWTVHVDSGAAADHTVSWLLGLVTAARRRAGRRVPALRRPPPHARRRRSPRRLLAELAQRLNGAQTVDDIAQAVTTLGREPVQAAASSIAVIEGDALDVHHGDTVPEEYRTTRQSIPLDANLGSRWPPAATRSVRGSTGLRRPVPGCRRAHRRGPGVPPDPPGGRDHHRRHRPPLGPAPGVRRRGRGDPEHHRGPHGTVHRAGQAGGGDGEGRPPAEQLARLAQGLASRISSVDVMSSSPGQCSHRSRPTTRPWPSSTAIGCAGTSLRARSPTGSRTCSPRPCPRRRQPAGRGGPYRRGGAARRGGRPPGPLPPPRRGWIALGFKATANLPLRDRRGELIGALGVAWNRPVRPAEQLDRLATVLASPARRSTGPSWPMPSTGWSSPSRTACSPRCPSLGRLRCTARYVPASSSVGMGGDWYEGIVR